MDADDLFSCTQIVLSRQGDALRSELLSRYYGVWPMHSTKPATAKSSLSGSASSSAHDAERGLMILSRAQMTLHDVQVLYADLTTDV